MVFSYFVHKAIQRKKFFLFPVEDQFHSRHFRPDSRICQHSFLQYGPCPEEDIVIMAPSDKTVLFPFPIDQAVMILDPIKGDPCIIQDPFGLHAFFRIKVGYTDMPYLSFPVKTNDLTKVFFDIGRKMQPVDVNMIPLKVLQILFKGSADLTRAVRGSGSKL